MKINQITEKVFHKIMLGIRDFYERDFDTISKAITVGEWIYLQQKDKKQLFLAMVNLHAVSGPIVRVLGEVASLSPSNDNENDVAETFIKEKIRAAKSKRSVLGITDSHRIFFGASDGLSGLVVDKFENGVFIQLNSAGVDRYRDKIKKTFEEEYQLDCYFLDKESYRKSEGLPIHEQSDNLPSIISIKENGFSYEVKKEIWQKTGFYFDHRENRARLELILKRSCIKKNRGLDLFCYAGSWGLHLLRSGILNVDFVDQGNLEEVNKQTLMLNKMDSRGRFIRGDVYQVLDQYMKNDEKFNVIVCDPPAFSKSLSDRKSALVGYEKLYKKMIEILEPQGMVVLASCTHGVSHAEMCELWQRVVHRAQRKSELVDIGIQGADHPFESLNSSEHYIKYLCYFVI